MQARAAGDGQFAFKYVMIDKSKAEMAAISSLQLKFLLCYFHLLQDWERFLRGSESGVRSGEERHLIMLNVASLKKQRDHAIFELEVRGCLKPLLPRPIPFASAYTAVPFTAPTSAHAEHVDLAYCRHKSS